MIKFSFLAICLIFILVNSLLEFSHAGMGLSSLNRCINRKEISPSEVFERKWNETKIKDTKTSEYHASLLRIDPYSGVPHQVDFMKDLGFAFMKDGIGVIRPELATFIKNYQKKLMEINLSEEDTLEPGYLIKVFNNEGTNYLSFRMSDTILNQGHELAQEIFSFYEWSRSMAEGVMPVSLGSDIFNFHEMGHLHEYFQYPDVMRGTRNFYKKMIKDHLLLILQRRNPDLNFSSLEDFEKKFEGNLKSEIEDALKPFQYRIDFFGESGKTTRIFEDMNNFKLVALNTRSINKEDLSHLVTLLNNPNSSLNPQEINQLQDKYFDLEKSDFFRLMGGDSYDNLNVGRIFGDNMSTFKSINYKVLKLAITGELENLDLLINKRLFTKSNPGYAEAIGFMKFINDSLLLVQKHRTQDPVFLINKIKEQLSTNLYVLPSKTDEIQGIISVDQLEKNLINAYYIGMNHLTPLIKSGIKHEITPTQIFDDISKLELDPQMKTLQFISESYGEDARNFILGIPNN